MNPSYFESGRPALRMSVVLYLDMLGSSEMAIDTHAEDYLLQIFDAIEFARDFGLHDQTDGINYTMTSFTDHLALGWPIRDDGELELGGTLVETGYYQFALARSGLFARGGLTVGKVFVSKGFAFGPALVRAYEIESTRAKYPRVLISEEALELAWKHSEYYGGMSTSPYDSHLLVDQNGDAFINYLAVINDDEMDSRQELLTHKRLVEQRIEAFASEPDILEKYLWLADLHNYWCSHASPHGSDVIIGPAPGVHRFRKVSATEQRGRNVRE